MKRRDLILFILGGALIGLYYFSEHLSGSLGMAERLFSERFLNEIKSIELASGDDVVIISKAKEPLQLGLEEGVTNGQWLMTSPSISLPSTVALNQLFSIVSNLKPLHSFKSDSYSDFGLTSPKNFMRITSATESKLLKIGQVNTVSKRRYAAFDGRKEVFLLDDGLISSLLKLKFIELKPLNVPIERVSKVVVEGAFSKGFRRVGAIFQSDDEHNLDPQLIEQYIQSILSLKAIRTITARADQGENRAKIILDWIDRTGAPKHTEILISASKHGTDLLSLPDVEFLYEYGAEMARLLDRKVSTLFNKKLLRSVVLEDYFESCVGITLKRDCKVQEERVYRLQDQIRRTEVLSLERIPGRFMMSTKPKCRLKLGRARTSFEVGGIVPGDGAIDPPRFFVSDSASDHYRGVISGLVANEFCLAVERLCNEAKAVCGG